MTVDGRCSFCREEFGKEPETYLFAIVMRDGGQGIACVHNYCAEDFQLWAELHRLGTAIILDDKGNFYGEDSEGNPVIVGNLSD